MVYEAHDVVHKLMRQLKKRNTPIKRIETKACHFSDQIVCFTEEDKRELMDLGARSERIIVSPMGVDVGNIVFNGPNLNSKNILFLGNLYYGPNQLALEVLLSRIIPALRKRDKEIKLIVVGDCPSSILKKHSGKRYIVFRGMIDDLNETLKETTIAVAPIQYGSGMRVKLLYYMAAGIPTITTALGATGIDSNGSMILEDDISKYPTLIFGLLNNKRRLKRMGIIARKAVKEKYNWARIADGIVEMYESLGRRRSSLRCPEPEKSFVVPPWLEENLKKGRFSKAKPIFKSYVFGVLFNDNIEIVKCPQREPSV